MPSSRTEPQRRGDGRLSRPPEQPAPQVETTRRGAVLAALPLVIMIAFLAVQVALLAEQRRLIAGQKELQEALTSRSLPVLDAARPLVEGLAEDRTDARAAGRRADRLVRETAPLVRDLRAARAPEALAATGELAEAALQGDRLARALDATLAALVEQQRLGLLRDADRAAELAPTVVDLQRRTLAVQLESRDIQKTTLAIQQEALARIRSIDQKTGGPAPGAVPTAVP